ncbi:peptidyl-tRNA hydrolase [Halobacillus alkaliphilus]|uniref:Peptidyl-tRNA hydrolase n=1 Tax=Halobacillus alkaliphilus TaxID=396056 RepID=A0A1I2RH40_9BACI|nr:aminoacyl-tRNA hydrolase [Halobacillus alkaliphilus]SFG37076.1 peptidyl-tRNA hydrolase [Halobacillus alkaliphilus]
MKCIVGLGNPGKKYAKTRHNIGFMILDELVKQNQWSLEQTKFRGIYTTEHVNGEKILLLKPQTFMNLSGESLVQFMNFFDLEADDILVVYDDLDLPPGKIRLRKKGGHGGHNGIRNIIDHLGTKEFNRLRVGVGRPDGPVSVVDYVLGTFTKQEQGAVSESIDAAVKACEAWMTQPFNEVMNDFNA